MTLKTLATYLCALVMLVSVASQSGRADAPPDVAPALPESVYVLMRVVRTAKAGAASEASSMGSDLRAGEEGTSYLTTGSFDAGGLPRETLCTDSGGTGILPAAMASTAVNAWTMDARLLDATMDSIRVDVDWSRQQAARRGDLRTTAGDSRTLMLREGDAHTLDFVAAPDGDLECGRNLRVDVVTMVKEDPRFDGAIIDYDLWLMDEAPGSATVVRHVVLDGGQGERVDFAFTALSWPLGGVLLQGGAEAQVLARFSGTLRGRLRDGDIVDVVLDASRQVGINNGPRGPGGYVGDGGRKVLRLRDGETLALVMPPAQGISSMALDGTSASAWDVPGTASSPSPGSSGGVTLTPETVSVDFGRFLEGHVQSLRLTARRHGP